MKKVLVSVAVAALLSLAFVGIASAHPERPGEIPAVLLSGQGACLDFIEGAHDARGNITYGGGCFQGPIVLFNSVH